MLPLWRELMDLHAELNPLFERRAGAEKAWLTYAQNNIKEKDALVLVAEEKGRIIAYGMATVLAYPPVFTTTHFGELVEMAVHAERRRQGLGTALTARIKAWFETKNVRHVEVRLLCANPVSSRFWRAVGFEPYMEILAMDLTQTPT
jgi:GNAT superfamily N-acetyltransferase